MGQEDLTNLIGQIKLIRSGIAAKRAQLKDIRDILSNSQLNGKSGLHCDKGSTEAICEILDKLDKDNDQEEAELNTEERGPSLHGPMLRRGLCVLRLVVLDPLPREM